MRQLVCGLHLSLSPCNADLLLQWRCVSALLVKASPNPQRYLYMAPLLLEGIAA